MLGVSSSSNLGISIISTSSFTILLSFLLSFTTSADAYYLLNYTRYVCLSSGAGPKTSTLTHLFTTLSSKSNTSLFYNSSVSTSPNTTVYALHLCRGDDDSDSATTCSKCITGAASQILDTCQASSDAIIWKEQCMLRYASNYNIFSAVDATLYDEYQQVWFNQNNVTDNMDAWKKLLTPTIGNVTARAAAAGGGKERKKKFATQEAGYWDMSTMYSLAECTPDLSDEECAKCFKVAVKNLPVDHIGGIVLLPSCNVRYELYSFYKVASDQPTSTTDSGSGQLGVSGGGKGKKKKLEGKVVVIAVVASVALLIVLVGLWIVSYKKRRKHHYKPGDEVDFTTPESLQFDFDTLESATGGFSTHNKIGQGGFGSVYRGTLPDGREVAVKRLSRKSEQGAEEFKTEVVLVAKLQHRNLVRLLGFCLRGDEKLLVYEFVAHQSLNYYIFDSRRQRMLEWATRFGIIEGIARGMLYLHEDSRPRIIHRDLKASNILLDDNMESKIADFGMARIFGEDQTHDLTKRVAGTHGYMAPEYVVQGQYSAKSDVYSFGVIVLEIISGKKNSSFYQTGLAEDLLTYVWELWLEGKPFDIMDTSIRDSPPFPKDQVKRSIQIGLLCVQKDPEKRPTMAMVVQMLNVSAFANLPSPQRPAFTAAAAGSNEKRQHQIAAAGSDQSDSRSVPSSSNGNDPSITELYPR